MSEEIWDLTEARQRMYMKELERCKNEDCDFYLEHNDVNEFYDYITNLQEENERLNNIIIDKKLTINELEKYLIKMSDRSWDDNGAYDDVLDKIKELKGSDKSEK